MPCLHVLIGLNRSTWSISALCSDHPFFVSVNKNHKLYYENHYTILSRQKLIADLGVAASPSIHKIFYKRSEKIENN